MKAQGTLEPFVRQKTVLLTTYRRNGAPVGTPVNIAVEGARAFVSAHLLALKRAPSIGFGRYIIAATTPFLPEDLLDLRVNAPLVVKRRVPEYEVEYARRGWKMFPSIDRVYVNKKARTDLYWNPRYNFEYVLRRLRSNEEFRSELSITVGSKGYHTEKFVDGPYPWNK